MAALRAIALRVFAVRCRAWVVACFDSSLGEADSVLSRLSAA